MAAGFPEIEPAPPPRAYPVLAWLVILATVVFIITRSAETAPQRQERLEQITTDLQVRTLIGYAELLGAKKTNSLEQAQHAFAEGSDAQRLRFAVVAGELEGPKDAVTYLAKLQNSWKDRADQPAPEDAACAALLQRLYSARAVDPSKPAHLMPEEQAQLRQHLGWVGALALTEPGSAEHAELLAQAWRTAVAALVLGAAFLGVLGLGFLLVIVAVALWAQGKWHGGLPRTTGHGGLYAEAFALWMAVYVGLSFAGRLVPGASANPLLGSAVGLASLAVLFWPRWRGIAWPRIRADLGLFVGPRPWREVLIGMAAYTVALLGAVAMALAVWGVLNLVRRLSGHGGTSPLSNPGHPVVELLVRGNGWTKIQVLLAAAVAAPLLEETVFRGLLYRHLRDALAGWGRTASVVLAGVLSGVVFAVIHPQGPKVAPMLATLALVFALVREWRGTLLPAMVAHGLNNGLLVIAWLAMES